MSVPAPCSPESFALFLDFDGTLVDIAPRPEAVRLCPATRDVLVTLHQLLGGALAVISGRSLVELDQHLAPLVLAGAGSHGIERRDAHGCIRRCATHDASLELARQQLAPFATRHGLLLESKPGALSLHYRNRPELAEQCQALIREIAGRDDALRCMHGKMLCELAGAQSNKGTAVEAFLDEPPFSGRIPIAVGDDTTDEDAFAAAGRRGGWAIKIGDGPSCARYRLAGAREFRHWLRQLSHDLRRAP